MLEENDVSQPESASVETVAELARSVGRLRVWVIVMSVLVVVTTCAPTALGGLALLVGVTAGGPRLEPDSVERAIKQGLDRQLESVVVREVKVKSGDAPFPFSLLDGGQGVALEARTTGGVEMSEVLQADGVLTAEDLLPTVGPLTTRMSDTRLAALLNAYRGRSSKPFGQIVTYSELHPDSTQTESRQLEVSGRQYPAERVWVVVTGYQASGESVDISSAAFAERAGLVFFENAEGEFEYVGSETVDHSGVIPID